MDRAWIVLFVAGIMEVIWATAMDYSEGFTVWYFDVMALYINVCMF